MKLSFEETVEYIEEAMALEWKEMDEFERMKLLETQKRAIMGHEEDMNYYKEKIGFILEERNLTESDFPSWYLSLTEAVFNEMYGLSGLAPWAYDENERYRKSSSAKLIGERLFCLIDGKSELQPQRISRKRREQLKRAFLMSDPKERLEKGFHEVYLKNGIRVTIFSGDRTKEDQDIMVFRKYLFDDLSLEKLAEYGTIPECAIELFKTMISIGFNVLFAGPVRSGKTTFLQTWQKYEDESLEGLCISTDPETDWSRIMPNAPLMQLVCDNEELEGLIKSLLRGDNDYILLEEMRDEVAFRTALEITATGTQRSKATVHSQDPVNLPYRIAAKIRSRYGGDVDGIVVQFFRSFNYCIELCQVEGNRAKKKMRAIYEYCYDMTADEISVHKICGYIPNEDRWEWHFHIGDDKRELGMLSPHEMEEMERILKNNEKVSPLNGLTTMYPRYYKPSGIRGE